MTRDKNVGGGQRSPDDPGIGPDQDPDVPGDSVPYRLPVGSVSGTKMRCNSSRKSGFEFASKGPRNEPKGPEEGGRGSSGDPTRVSQVGHALVYEGAQEPTANGVSGATYGVHLSGGQYNG